MSKSVVIRQEDDTTIVEPPATFERVVYPGEKITTPIIPEHYKAENILNVLAKEAQPIGSLREIACHMCLPMVYPLDKGIYAHSVTKSCREASNRLMTRLSFANRFLTGNSITTKIPGNGLLAMKVDNSAVFHRVDIVYEVLSGFKNKHIPFDVALSDTEKSVIVVTNYLTLHPFISAAYITPSVLRRYRSLSSKEKYPIDKCMDVLCNISASDSNSHYVTNSPLALLYWMYIATMDITNPYKSLFHSTDLIYKMDQGSGPTSLAINYPEPSIVASLLNDYPKLKDNIPSTWKLL